MTTPELKVITEEQAQIAKPGKFDLNKFRSKRRIGSSRRSPTYALPVLKLSEAKDFVRLHPDEEDYWTTELCFVNVPAKGQKKDTLHLIDDDLAAIAIPRKPLSEVPPGPGN